MINDDKYICIYTERERAREDGRQTERGREAEGQKAYILTVQSLVKFIT